MYAKPDHRFIESVIVEQILIGDPDFICRKSATGRRQRDIHNRISYTYDGEKQVLTIQTKEEQESHQIVF